MKHFLAVWYDYSKMHYVELDAEDLKSARAKAFQLMCDCAGDKLYDLEVYERKTVCSCSDEYNPCPGSAFQEYSGRDYLTGKRVKPIKDRV